MWRNSYTSHDLGLSTHIFIHVFECLCWNFLTFEWSTKKNDTQLNSMWQWCLWENHRITAALHRQRVQQKFTCEEWNWFLFMIPNLVHYAFTCIIPSYLLRAFLEGQSIYIKDNFSFRNLFLPNPWFFKQSFVSLLMFTLHFCC